jgi:Ca2+-binding RTX toxin-like protein
MRRSFVVVAAALAAPLAPIAVPPAAAAVTCHGQRAPIVGTDPREVLTGTPGRDVIAGLDGDDTINGRGGDDLICGGRGADKLKGGGGDDRLYGGLDRLFDNDEGEEERIGDQLSGGRGDDVLRPGQDNREADDITLDAISWAESRRPVRIKIYAGEATGEGHDRFTTDQTWVVGSSFGDVIRGSSRDDRINSGPGPDVVHGGAGNDRIIVDSGRLGGHEADVVYGEGGDDAISATAGQDVLYGGAGNDAIDDTGRSNDVLLGQSGNDLLIGQVGDTGKAQRYSGGPGQDQLDLFTTLINPSAAPSTGTWNMATGAMQITFNSTVSFAAEDFEFASFNTYGTSWDVTGSDDADDLNASGTAGTHFQALGGDDSFFGSVEDDVFDGGDGTDTAQAMGAGNDTCISVEVSPPGDCDVSS